MNTQPKRQKLVFLKINPTVVFSFASDSNVYAFSIADLEKRFRNKINTKRTLKIWKGKVILRHMGFSLSMYNLKTQEILPSNQFHLGKARLRLRNGNYVVGNNIINPSEHHKTITTFNFEEKEVKGMVELDNGNVVVAMGDKYEEFIIGPYAFKVASKQEWIAVLKKLKDGRFAALTNNSENPALRIYNSEFKKERCIFNICVPYHRCSFKLAQAGANEVALYNYMVVYIANIDTKESYMLLEEAGITKVCGLQNGFVVIEIGRVIRVMKDRKVIYSWETDKISWDLGIIELYPNFIGTRLDDEVIVRNHTGEIYERYPLPQDTKVVKFILDTE
jgi:hypothetical protein